ncbi:MAG: lytic transglycosylase domain-containing protein [Capnocytophaga sp.]|nr:lytic transglycosylase domain-containing protein [Capnocytophaga sp.]
MIIKNIIVSTSVIGVAMLLINASATHQTDSIPVQEQVSDTLSFIPERTYNIYALDMPKNLNFAGESVPMDIEDVKERFDRELLVNTYWQSNALLLIKRANKFFPIIEPILKKNNIPDDFKYLALIESGLQNVVSPSGAAGFWQFMKDTGKEYRLEIDTTVDERYHLEKATQAACDYLKKAKTDLGNWTLAAAAYNAGKNGIKTQIDRQKVDNYYDLFLNTETSRYVFRILALKEIVQNPQKYGFNLKKEHLYELEPVKYVEVTTSIENLADFAKQYNTNYKMIRLLNPWIRDISLENKKGKTYLIKVPEK